MPVLTVTDKTVIDDVVVVPGMDDLLEQAYLEIIENDICVERKNLSVNGSDLIAMGMKPGEEIGTVLDLLFDIVINDPKLNEREKLLERANKLITPFI